MSSCPDILILGAAKSGTTALFYAVRQAMSVATGSEIKGRFEPTKATQLVDYLDNSPDAAKLAKMLLRPFYRGLASFADRFDKAVIIYRDPRDNIVSRLLYRPQSILQPNEPEKIDAFLALIREKEAKPGSISVTQLLLELQRLSGETATLTNFRDNALVAAKAKVQFGDRFLMFPYTDLIAGRFDALSEYLGIGMVANFQVDDKHGHIERSKASGEWTNWFLPEDLPFFADKVADQYRLLGFDPNERPAAAPSIDPTRGSEYLERQFAVERTRWDIRRGARRERGQDAGGDGGIDAGDPLL